MKQKSLWIQALGGVITLIIQVIIVVGVLRFMGVDI